MRIDVPSDSLTWQEAYRLCISFINPRPIALVSTMSADGRHNLAPFSFYNMVCANPPVVMICPGLRRDGSEKDTLRNLRHVPEFVVATVDEPLAARMVRCAADLPYGQSEFDFSGLTPAPPAVVSPPLVLESPINVECRVRQVVAMGSGPGSSQVVFGDIRVIHVHDDLLSADRTVDPRRLRTVGRLGGAWYCAVNDPFQLQIPVV
jgi:flavin reductase (DIM6/NTAB) family NADH-FMN oxidoreductase RutF